MPERLAEFRLPEVFLDLAAAAVEVLDAPRRALPAWDVVRMKLQP
jgi:hypothetical protein